MKELLKKYWKYLLPLVMGIFIGLMINVPSCNKIEPKVIEVPVHDTITIDSIRIEEKTKWKYDTKFDTVTCYCSDTDTVFVPITIPIGHYTYVDTIETDTTSAELKIAYQGYKSKIDSVSLIYNYTNKTVIIPEPKKKVSPFITSEIGPSFAADFKTVQGVATQVGAGVMFKNGWGISGNYELTINDKLSHNVKLGIIKKW